MNKNMKTNTKKLIDIYNKTKGRFMSLEIENSKTHEIISCKKVADKNSTIVVLDPNNNNRNRVIKKSSLKAIRCGELIS